MAILFGRISNIKRGEGGSAVKAAAYRSCSRLTLYVKDKESNVTVDFTWDYTNKRGLDYSQIHAPDHAPGWVYDRQTLWQKIENVETKSNARLAGEYMLALPKEFSAEQNIELIKEFAEEVFVSRDIIVDANFHNDNPNNPHVHFMYVLRTLEEKLEGEFDFSDHRCRDLQSRAFLDGVLKEAHKNLQNIHLKRNGFDQQLEWGLAPGQEATIHHGGNLEIIKRNEQIIFKNAERIIADPSIVIDKLDFNKTLFTREDIEKELEKALLVSLKNVSNNVSKNLSKENNTVNTVNATNASFDSFDFETAFDIYVKNELVGLLDSVLLSPKLTLINACDLKERIVFAKSVQVELEKRFISNAKKLAKRTDHSIVVEDKDIAPYGMGRNLKKLHFSQQQKQVIKNICAGSNLTVLEGWPGAGKSTVTKDIARHYKKAGYEVIAAAPTNKAAQELESKLGIKAYTTAALRMKWQKERGQMKTSLGLAYDYYKQPFYNGKEGILDQKTFLILDEASMLDLPSADYFASEVNKSGAKLLALGDNNQNQAIGAKGAFARMSEFGNYNILTEINRHQNANVNIRELHIKATTALCNYDIATAISIYEQLGTINLFANEEEKIQAIAERYVLKLMEIAENGVQGKGKSQSTNIAEAAKHVVISAYTNAEIKQLNSRIRESLKLAGVLTRGSLFRSGGIYGNSEMVELSIGERIIFTSNLWKEDGIGGVYNNEFATVTKILSVDKMGCGEFLAKVEGASGARTVRIRTGEEGRIITFRHGYAVTNHAVQGASVPHKIYSIDKYSGYAAMLVGLTRHKISLEIFAAKNILEDEVYRTKDLDIARVKEEFIAIAYKYVAITDDNGKTILEKEDVALWKLGLYLLASKRSDLSFAIDGSYGKTAVELQKIHNAHSEQLENLRLDLKEHELALSQYEVFANDRSANENYGKNHGKNKGDNKNHNSEDNAGIDRNQNHNNKQSSTAFELLASEHFKLKEDIIFDVKDVVSAPNRFKHSNVGADGHLLDIEAHIAALKAGVIESGNGNKKNKNNKKSASNSPTTSTTTTTPLNWSDLSMDDQDLILWSYIDKEDKERLGGHYHSILNLIAEIQDKAHALSGIWEELKEAGYKDHESLDGNYLVVRKYIVARNRAINAFEENEKLNAQLQSAKLQKLLVAAIKEKYSIKLKFVNTTINGMVKANNDFIKQKEEADAKKEEELAEKLKRENENNNQQTKDNSQNPSTPLHKPNSIEEDREIYLRSLKSKEFQAIISNSDLFVFDVMESAGEATELGKLMKSIVTAREESAVAKSDRLENARIIIENWHGHVNDKFAGKQPSFAKIVPSLNVNYYTLLKHTGFAPEKHYFEKLMQNSLGQNADYHEIMRLIYKAGEQELTASDIDILLKAHDGLCAYTDAVSEHIEELKRDRLSSQNDLNIGKTRLKEIEYYRETEFAYFLGSIYKGDNDGRNADKKNIDQYGATENEQKENIIKENGKEVISRLDQLLAKTDDKLQLATVIANNPEMLGTIKHQDMISKITALFWSLNKYFVDVNLEQLGDRVKKYIEHEIERQTPILQKIEDGTLQKDIAEIDQHIGDAKVILPSNLEIGLLEDIGHLHDLGHLQNIEHLQDSVQDSAANEFSKFIKNINKLLLSDKAQDALFAYQVKYNIFFDQFANSGNVERIGDIGAENIAAIAANDSARHQIKQNRQIRVRDERLKYDDVKAALNSSVIENIFNRYALNINADGKIEKKGSDFKIGSLHMKASGGRLGLWKRFSDGSGGDIFTFVQQASNCSKYEALEIVASHAGVVANRIYGSVGFSANNQQQENNEQNTQNANNEINKIDEIRKIDKTFWSAYDMIPEFAPEFNPRRDLAFLEHKNSKIAYIHEYRNANDELLGYVARVEEKNTGKKQVLPVAYCYNEYDKAKKEAERESNNTLELDVKSAWRLKGFSDDGHKPIYGVEKLAYYPNRPVLIVEGEKTADSAQELFPDHVVVTWLGGAQAVGKVDWQHLKDRVVTIWPDNDKPGIEAAENIANHIDQVNGFTGLVSIIDTQKLDLPEKWDLADKLPENSKIAAGIDLSNLRDLDRMPKIQQHGHEINGKITNENINDSANANSSVIEKAKAVSAEINQVQWTINEFKSEKELAKTHEELFSIIRKESEYLLGLDGNLQYPEDHDKQLLAKIERVSTAAASGKNISTQAKSVTSAEKAAEATLDNTILLGNTSLGNSDKLKNLENLHNHLESVAYYARYKNILSDNQLIKHLKANHDITEIYHNISQTCLKYNSRIINKHYKEIMDYEDVHHDGHKFDCPIKYLEHWKNNVDHSLLPMKTINQRLNHHIQIERDYYGHDYPDHDLGSGSSGGHGGHGMDLDL